MALVIDQITKEGARILVWKDEEDFDFFYDQVFLFDGDNLLLAKHKSDRRKKDLLISRFLLQKIVCNAHVLYSENGKPYLSDYHSEISISHTKDIVAVIVHSTKKVAIDVEYIDAKVERLKSRFLSNYEMKQANTVEKSIMFWSAKESLFKFDDNQGLDFTTELSLTLNGDNLIGCIRNSENFRIDYQICENWVMTYIVD